MVFGCQGISGLGLSVCAIRRSGYGEVEKRQRVGIVGNGCAKIRKG